MHEDANQQDELIDASTYLAKLPDRIDLPIGCIGTGFIMADCHLPAYKQNNLNVVAIAGRDIQKARSVAQRHSIPNVHQSARELLSDSKIQVIDIAVPPDVQLDVIKEVVSHSHIRGILAQKPLGRNYREACQIVSLCQERGITLCVNQNMRFDQSIRACKTLLSNQGVQPAALGDPVLATIDMRAIPHWMAWQERQGWLTCRIMSIHHLDTMRYWFGNPERVFASFAPDPRTKFPHQDGIGLYILEYASGLRCQICDDVWTGPAREGSASDIGIRWRVEGTKGIARGTIGWPKYPERTPSTLDYTIIGDESWRKPRWDEVWFPDAFIGPMADLLLSLEEKHPPSLSGHDNLATMALVDACYQSANQHRAIALDEVLTQSSA